MRSYDDWKTTPPAEVYGGPLCELGKDRFHVCGAPARWLIKNRIFACDIHKTPEAVAVEDADRNILEGR